MGEVCGWRRILGSSVVNPTFPPCFDLSKTLTPTLTHSFNDPEFLTQVSEECCMWFLCFRDWLERHTGQHKTFSFHFVVVQVLRMELSILNALRYDMTVVTPRDFVGIYLKVAQASPEVCMLADVCSRVGWLTSLALN